MMARGLRVRFAARCAACALVLIASACDAVGSSLVDARSMNHSELGSIMLKCELPPPCDDHAVDALPDKPQPAPIDFAACGQQPPSCSEEPTRAGATTSGCRQPTTLDQLQSSGGALPGCAAHRIANLDADDARELTLDGVQWTSSDVSIETRTPLSITLRSASLTDVVVRLAGPVRLSVLDSARFDQVRILSVPLSAQAARSGQPAKPLPDGAAAQHPSVELDQVDAHALWIDGAERFEGEVHVANSRLAGGQLAVDELKVESTHMASLQLRAVSWAASDVSISDSQLAIEHGLVSASAFTGSDVLRCGALTVVASTIDTMRLSPCDDRVRLYDSAITHADFGGEIESDESEWVSSQLGARERTALTLWHSSMDVVAFCSGVDALRAGPDTSMTCATCEGSLAEPREDEAMCAIPNAEGVVRVKASRCTCERLATLPVCGEPLPLRTRRLGAQ